jgi:hypothetical protein
MRTLPSGGAIQVSINRSSILFMSSLAGSHTSSASSLIKLVGDMKGTSLYTPKYLWIGGLKEERLVPDLALVQIGTKYLGSELGCSLRHCRHYPTKRPSYISCPTLALGGGEMGAHGTECGTVVPKSTSLRLNRCLPSTCLAYESWLLA